LPALDHAAHDLADRPQNIDVFLWPLSSVPALIEADESSGAIITAHLAVEQNRDVFAIPGSILSPASRGTNHLIQEGAKLVREYTDILEELNLMTVARQIEMREVLPTSDTESLLLKQLTAEPTHIDEVCRSSGLPVATVSSTLAMMELKGMVKGFSPLKNKIPPKENFLDHPDPLPEK
jgi:DNA processing protein